jgi:hypothetical protein
MIVHLGEDGAPITSFGEDGHVISDLGGPGDAWYGMALTPDETQVIIVGYKGVDANGGGNDDAVVARVAL